MLKWVFAAVFLSAGALSSLRQSTSECQSNLKQYAVGLQMYMQDYDDTFPPMKFAPQVQNRVGPYVKSRLLLNCPKDYSAYLPNPALNYLPLAEVTESAKTVMLRDAKPHKDEGGNLFWNVANVDGHVTLVRTVPALGKPAPTPPPLPPGTRHTQLKEIQRRLTHLRGQLKAVDARIRALKAKQHRLRSL